MGECCREVMIREMRGGAASDPLGGVNCVTVSALGYFDLDTRVLEPLDSPFGPRLLPM